MKRYADDGKEFEQKAPKITKALRDVLRVVVGRGFDHVAPNRGFQGGMIEMTFPCREWMQE